MTDGPAGRSRGRWMRWQTETDSPLSLHHNPSFSLPLFSFSACRDDAVPLVLWLRGGEGRGEDGEKVKRKKLHSSTINVYFGPLSSSSSPPILSHFCCRSSSISITSFLASPPPPPLCWSGPVVSIVPFGVIQLPPLFFAVSHCFFSTILTSKEFLPPRYAFSYLISVCTHLPERIFFASARVAFFQVNFSSSRVNRSAFVRARMWCFYKCVCVCDLALNGW